MTEKLKHMEMIQSVINRLASNSFQIKGWSVVLATALLALGTRGGSSAVVLVACVPVVVFWGLDAYYLSREKLFRQLYDRVRVSDEVDFSMDVAHLKKTGPFWARDWCLAVRSTTILPFYATLILVASAGLVVVCMTGGKA